MSWSGWQACCCCLASDRLHGELPIKLCQLLVVEATQRRELGHAAVLALGPKPDRISAEVKLCAPYREESDTQA